MAEYVRVSAKRIKLFLNAKHLSLNEASRRMGAPYDLYLRNKCRRPEFSLTKGQANKLAKVLSVSIDAIKINGNIADASKPKTKFVPIPETTKYLIIVEEKKGKLIFSVADLQTDN